jgi:restriction system protein
VARSVLSAIAQAQRNAARAQAARARANAQAQRQAERSRATAAREAARTQAAYARAARADAKERARLYAEARTAEVAANNEELEQQVADLQSLLSASLQVDDFIDLDSLKQAAQIPVWQHGHLEIAEPAPDPAQYTVPSPSGIGKLFGGKQHKQAVETAQAAYEQASEQHVQREQARIAALQQARASFDATTAAANAAAEKQHQEIDAFKATLASGDQDAVVTYFEMVLRRSSYPETFPQAFKLAYVPASRQIVLEFEFPPLEVVPTVKTYRYVKSQDSVTETARAATQIRALYSSALAQTTLRTLHELFEADRGRFLDVVVFNGMLQSIDPGTGLPIHPCLITVRTTREVFAELDLSHVDPMACLKHLSASVSANPAELAPVRPVLEFSMVDPRFVAETDVLSQLDRRPNLMDLSPTEFESLIQNLFSKMGLDTKQTRPSRDGGVDCLAYDTRAILGGKVVIQAKRYKNPVGVSAVRDLYGTVLNEGAAKGILVTTSSYGRGSYEFANDKPLEILDGANLLALLADHAGIEAQIIPPDTWHDPVPDAPASA